MSSAVGWTWCANRVRAVEYAECPLAEKTITPPVGTIPASPCLFVIDFTISLIRFSRSGIIRRSLGKPIRFMLSWENLSKSYGRRRLFFDLTGQLGAGELLAVTGRNGSGKSTFLKILAGLVRADTGGVSRPQGQCSIGYAAPDLSLYGELTGRENLEFFADVRGIGKAGIDTLLAQAGLDRAAWKPVSAYSSGMRQRLKVCCALLHSPAVLLLDEPTLALDSDGVAFVEQILVAHTKALGCAVVATNDPGEAERWGQGGALCLDTQR